MEYDYTYDDKDYRYIGKDENAMKNLLGITDAKELEKYEYLITSK